MHIRPDFFNSVAFLCIQTEEDGKSIRKPHGSTFLIDLPDEKNKNIYWPYFVTARHCIEDAETEDIWIRLNKKDIGFEDLLTKKDKWTTHHNADVAIIPLWSVDKSSAPLKITAISTNYFVDSKYHYNGPWTDIQPHHKLENPFVGKGGCPCRFSG